MKKAKYTSKRVLTCPYCNFQKPEREDDMPEQVDIINWNNDNYLCGNCGQEFERK